MEAMIKLVLTIIFFLVFAYSAYAGETTEAASYKDLFNIVWAVLIAVLLAYTKSIKSTFSKDLASETSQRDKLENILLQRLKSIDDKIDDMSKAETDRIIAQNKLMAELLASVDLIHSKFNESKTRMTDLSNDIHDNKKEIDWIKQQLPKFRKTGS